MNIPQVGQKYLCVCHDRKSYADFGQEVEVVKKQSGGVVSVKNTTTGKEFAWNYVDYPDDFKLVEFTTEHGTFFVNDLVSESPLGLQSWQAHDSLRVQDILAAMQRYVAANKAVPNEWLEELIDKIELEYTLELQGYHE